jgi:flagellar assembly factor FliW
MLKSAIINYIEKRFFMKFEITVPFLGFPEIKEVELQKIDDVFMKMQSTENKDVAFTLINPYALREYDFEVPQNIRELLSITEKSNLLIFNVLIIQTPIEESYVNFVAPIIFNTDTKTAAQFIIQDNTKFGVAEKISNYLKS